MRALLNGRILIGTALLALTAGAAAQDRISPELQALARQQAQIQVAGDTRPNTPGTGPYAAVVETDPTLANHVIYRPADLKALGSRKLGVMVWGNGGCRADGASARFHLAEIASHGFLVIAPGQIYSGPGALPKPPEPPRAADGKYPPPATTFEDMRAGLDWALAENRRNGSRYKGKIDPAQIAVAGHSCGGLQALQLAADPRVKAVLIHNSGIFNTGQSSITGLTLAKTQLDTLHTPVIYILGGAADIAYPNGTDDFRRITKVPAVLLNLPVGHGGTFGEINGGAVAQVAVDWLQWQLRGDGTAARTFTGGNCRLCQQTNWTIEKKQIP